jgi:hypothetical protein
MSSAQCPSLIARRALLFCPVVHCCLQDSQQAAGISLTNADKLVLLDPLLDEVSLHQLLSRVHRFGQQRPQEVLFMLPKGSMAWLLHQL